MDGKKRIFAAIKGENVDRPPIWLREGFNTDRNILKEPIVSEGNIINSEFTLGWKLSNLYQDLHEYVSPYIDIINTWELENILIAF